MAVDRHRLARGDLGDLERIANDAWAAGYYGVLYHWNGTAWTRAYTQLPARRGSGDWNHKPALPEPVPPSTAALTEQWPSSRP
jgi:hypothetical protein